MAELAAGPLLSARTGAAIGRVPFQPTGPPTWPQLLDPASSLATLLHKANSSLPCMEVPEYTTLGPSSIFPSDLLLLHISVSLSTWKPELLASFDGGKPHYTSMKWALALPSYRQRRQGSEVPDAIHPAGSINKYWLSTVY